MCLSTPGRVTQVNGALAEVESEGRLGWYNALPQPDIRVGDYVLTHANLIVAQLEPEEAQEMFAALEETRRLLEQDAVAPHQHSRDEPRGWPVR